jgi:TonB family protein
MQFATIRFGVAVVLAAALTAALAQPVPAASSPTPTERAQRDADKVFQMILQHADKPRRAPAATEPRTPAPVAAPRAVAPPAANTAPARVTEPRVTSSTPAAVRDDRPTSTSANTDAVPSGRAGAAAADAEIAAEPTPAAAAPVAALAPLAVATPRSLKLELVSSVEPDFPTRLVRQLGKGSVVVNFDVRPDGTVSRTEVTASSHRGLNEAAQAAVAAWRFKPISESMPGVVELKFE